MKWKEKAAAILESSQGPLTVDKLAQVLAEAYAQGQAAENDQAATQVESAHWCTCEQCECYPMDRAAKAIRESLALRQE